MDAVTTADARRVALADQLRSSLHVARLLLGEVLTDAYARMDPAGYRELAGKAGGELAMLLRMAARALPGADDQREIRALAAQLAPLARLPAVARSVLLRPSRASMHVLAHLCLTELGAPDEVLDRAARRALQASTAAANERVPYRQLDAAWTRHIAFGDHELRHPALLLSPIGAGVDLIAATTADAYAYTHALPYATDFGRVPLPSEVDRRRLIGIAEAIVLQALDDDDFDLLAEVLMAPPTLRRPWTPLLAFGWQVLDAAWQHFGFVPGPGLPPPRAGETRAEEVRRVLGTTYHTTFAAGLACATLLACDALPPPLARGGPPDADEPPGRGCWWRAQWRLLSPSARASMPLLRAGFALRRALDAGNLAAVHALLIDAAAAGLAEHPLMVQALEMLERAADLAALADHPGGRASQKATAAARPSAAIASITSR